MKIGVIAVSLDINNILNVHNLEASGERNTYNKSLQLENEIIGRADIPEVSSDKAYETMRYSGFIAQDVEIAAQSIGYEFSGVDAPQNDKNLYGLRYAEFVVPLVKAVQELSVENAQLKLQVTTVTLENAGLIQCIEKLESLLGVER